VIKIAKQPIGSTWIRRRRKIRGRMRYIYIRKVNGKYQIKMNRPEIHGIALANKVFGAKSKKSKKIDKSRSNKNLIRPTDKNIRRYRKSTGTADIKTVDTIKKH